MHSFSGFTASYVMNAAWETALVFVAAWLASRMLRQLGPHAEHATWVAALFTAVITPALPLLGQIPAALLGVSAAGGRAAIMLADPGAAAAHPGVLSIPQDWLWGLLAFYVALVAFFAGRLILSLRGAMRLVRNAVPPGLIPEQEEIWEKCRQACSLYRARMLASAEAPGPVALGLRRPVLLVPAGFAGRCTPEDFLAAVAHECAHLERRDFQKNLLYEVVSLALAFHPLIWVIKSRIAQTREMICDATATEGHVDARSYARSLLRLAAIVAAGPPSSTVGAIGIFDADILEKRIMRIRTSQRYPGAVVKWVLMGAAGAFLVSAAVGAAAMAVVVTPQAGSKDSSSASAYGPVHHVGHGVSAPVPLNNVEAEFPKSVRNDKKVSGGIVLLSTIVDAGGIPRDVHLVRSYRPDFDAEAVKAARKYRFKPAMLQGKPVAVSISIEVNFKRY
jgi:TonB family protein